MRAIDESEHDVVPARGHFHRDLRKAVQDLLPTHVAQHVREPQIFRAADVALELHLAVDHHHERRPVLQTAVVQTDRLLVKGHAEAVLAVGREVVRDLHLVACAQTRR